MAKPIKPIEPWPKSLARLITSLVLTTSIYYHRMTTTTIKATSVTYDSLQYQKIVTRLLPQPQFNLV